MKGDGTLSAPWDLVTAINTDEINNNVSNNRNLWVLNGSQFEGDFVINLRGTNERKIGVSPLSGSASINGSVTFSGNHYIIKNMELFWNGWTMRESTLSGGTPADLGDTKNIKGIAAGGSGEYIKLINCIIHDYSSPYFDDYLLGLEINGCVIYNIGWLGADRGHGHGLYLHNISPTMTIKDNIIFNNFGWGIHAYSPIGENLKNFSFIGNTCFNAGSLSGTARPNFLLGADSGIADVSIIANNMSYGGSPGLQFYVAGADNVTLIDNYMPDGRIGTYTAVSESGNYWGPGTGNQSFLRPNDYDANRANLTIYNEAQAASIVKDVSAVFRIGDSIKVRNVQDYFVDIQELTVAGDGTLTIDMQAVNRSVAAPYQWTAPATTFPDFGCFVLDRI